MGKLRDIDRKRAGESVEARGCASQLSQRAYIMYDINIHDKLAVPKVGS